VSIVSTYLSAPREGHLDQVFHIGYLKKVPKRSVAFDLGYPTIYGSRFKKIHWTSFYQDIWRRDKSYLAG
jgi:hypothetical protein